MQLSHNTSMRPALDAGTRLLRCLPAELAHDIGMKALQNRWFRSLLPNPEQSYDKSLAMDVPGIGRLAHPIGLAAGFDKNALAPAAFAQMGFSFIEVGTVTPRPQRGNPKPRMFRQPETRSIINRMGFNSDGAAVVKKRLAGHHWHHHSTPLGVNIGKNKDTREEDALADFNYGLATFAGLADYFVINISSPNTAGLRDLANADFLETLAKDNATLLKRMWVKLDPDMPRAVFQDLIQVIGEQGYQGLILANTHKVMRPEAGGLSGHPLISLANRCLEWAFEVHRGEIPTIASGGVISGLDVLEKIKRGADAVQIYTALVYRGPHAVFKILTELQAEMSLLGIDFLSEAKGSQFNT